MYRLLVLLPAALLLAACGGGSSTKSNGGAVVQSIQISEKEFSLTLDGKPYRQETQKYHARSLAALCARYEAVADKSALDPILADAGCLQPLAEAQRL